MKKPTIAMSALLLALLPAGGQEGAGPFGGGVESADPFADSKKLKKWDLFADSLEPGEGGPVSLCYEAFSLPLAEAASLRRENLSDSTLYQHLVERVASGKARQEAFMVARGMSGQKVFTESVSERIYGTQFEPPELPHTVGVAISEPVGEDDPASPVSPEKLNQAPRMSDLGDIRTPGTPTTFDTRHTGCTIEFEIHLPDSGDFVDLTIAPEHVSDAGRLTWGQGLAEVQMPLFESQHLMSAVSMPLNRPFLLGTMNRPPDSKLDKDSANRVWFAYVTISVVRH